MVIRPSSVWWFLASLLLIRVLAMIWLPLTDPTEARYAEIARKMAETGNWITPQFDYGIPFWAKPPLHTWLSALGILLLGPTPFAARLFILVASLTMLYAFWRWANSCVGRDTARTAVLVAASSAFFFGASAYVMTDMVLTLGLTLCMAGFFAGLGGSRSWGWLFFVGIAVGLLAKGPVATVLAALPIAAFMLWRGGWRDLLNLPWLGGIALVLVTVVPWYVAAEIATPGFLYYFIIGEHIERFLVPGWTGDLYGAGRAHAYGMIWVYFLACALPWSFFLPEFFYRLRRGLPIRSQADGLELYLFFWVLSPLFVFTAAANILPAYVLPAILPAALLGTLLWRSSRMGGDLRAALAAGIMAVVFAVLTLGAALFPDLDALPSQAHLISEAGPGRIALLGQRNYSAEFYTRATIARFENTDALAVWLAQGGPASILVPTPMQAEFVDRFGTSTELKDSNNRYALFVSKPSL
ncbi:phospholipid carrier-dependent glycosyltransferase [Mesorhizobium sp. NBSH29]|uniref:ArnT family glycosyltransferase n=1 Tax=Mesorhizobium sp. NBSH29 TaxID=2654249 RepID=UPI001896619E|nr:glycosyltransferase family 39 protein [Mesorhizobium sp. NBSH29]QPC86453.1 phospholipid carrier-dependent glycosyltransferase [Mesorhizobium sp. NBSH29]